MHRVETPPLSLLLSDSDDSDVEVKKKQHKVTKNYDKSLADARLRIASAKQAVDVFAAAEKSFIKSL